ncbi:AP-3 complex subunit sigma-2-like isoform X3 [Dermacentor andersoni]|uniref:AP-3 complex subunit sigma-2-like isoform X3 n=1 Tax=Dermacentor andersoni TaxID=34620 RepID=UPI0024162858|nr:AP-3 complex subunit sigma-2-like isoform X3 [Dermacentor andersoni]
MIKAILIFNQYGKIRLTKFYEHFHEEEQQHIIREVFQLVSRRADDVCNFLEGGDLVKNSDYKIIYRRYATLFIVFCADSSESELGILDLIQVHYILNELVMGGMVVDTNMTELMTRVTDQATIEKQEGGIAKNTVKAITAVKNVNLSRHIKDMKLPDFATLSHVKL